MTPISDILSGPVRRQAKRLRDAMLRRERIAAERAEARAAVKAVRAAKARELVAGVIERLGNGRWRVTGQRRSYSGTGRGCKGAGISTCDEE